ncbi:MAG: hypothetical protein H0U16_04685 [Actinobacteria bacterium]|nr:hypothetical protein [Actinomycetota bacterium]
MLSSPLVRARIETLAASSAGQHNLSLAKLDALLLPIPSLDTQADGLRHLSEVDDQISRMRAALTAAETHGAALRRSLLTAAFSGRLTPSHADESEIEEMITA